METLRLVYLETGGNLNAIPWRFLSTPSGGQSGPTGSWSVSVTGSGIQKLERALAALRRKSLF